MTALLYEQHMHTPLCGHSEGEIEEYAARAADRNLRGVVVTCHNPTPHNWWHCMAHEKHPEYFESIERARLEFEGEVEVLPGIEADWLPDMEDYLRDELPRHPYSHVLGSLHPQTEAYRKIFWHGDDLEFQKVYFENLARSAESGLFDTLSHPDLIKNETPKTWRVEAVWPEVEAALDRIAATGVAMELNTSGLNKSYKEMNPGPEILRAMAQRGIPVVVGSDAHSPTRVADNWELAFDLLHAAGFEKVSYFTHRQRHDVALDVARASLRTP
jgi:histidinol-phosphatase (PHP family)